MIPPNRPRRLPKTGEEWSGEEWDEETADEEMEYGVWGIEKTNYEKLGGKEMDYDKLDHGKDEDEEWIVQNEMV